MHTHIQTCTNTVAHAQWIEMITKTCRGREILCRLHMTIFIYRKINKSEQETRSERKRARWIKGILLLFHHEELLRHTPNQNLCEFLIPYLMTADEESNTNDSFPVAAQVGANFNNYSSKSGKNYVGNSTAKDGVIIQNRSLSCGFYSQVHFGRWGNFRFGEGCVGFGWQC